MAFYLNCSSAILARFDVFRTGILVGSMLCNVNCWPAITAWLGILCARILMACMVKDLKGDTTVCAALCIKGARSNVGIVAENLDRRIAVRTLLCVFCTGCVSRLKTNLRETIKLVLEKRFSWQHWTKSFWKKPEHFFSLCGMHFSPKYFLSTALKTSPPPRPNWVS